MSFLSIRVIFFFYCNLESWIDEVYFPLSVSLHSWGEKGGTVLSFRQYSVLLHLSLWKIRGTNIKWKASEKNILPQRCRKIYITRNSTTLHGRPSDDGETQRKPIRGGGKRAWQGPRANVRRRFDKSSVSWFPSGAHEGTEESSATMKRERMTGCYNVSVLLHPRRRWGRESGQGKWGADVKGSVCCRVYSAFKRTEAWIVARKTEISAGC